MEVDKEAKPEAVKPRAFTKICPFSVYTVPIDSAFPEKICARELCKIWDVKRSRCQIENLGEILENLSMLRAIYK